MRQLNFVFCVANAHQIAKIRSHCDINNNFLMYWWNLYYIWVVSFKLLYSNISYLSRAVTKIACSWLLVGGELNKSKMNENPVLISYLVYLNITMVHVWSRLDLRSPPNPKLHTLLITTTKPPCVLQLTQYYVYL